ncbi:MAG TPA: tryptophan synthase subunit alpha, partial [Feifaniaceae bacterium]|nr:tryptophan synthase subunit alpha [Feifaniaceae bacterium]
MSNIQKAFQNGKAFIGFLTGCDPDFEGSIKNILAMARGGADLIEIGVPFSDPVAEGPVIQAANLRALASGATTERVFELAERVRKETDVPLVFLTYLNPVFKYGYGRFFARCKEAGVDGVIIPDLPYEEQGEAAPYAEKYGVDIISLVAPTSKERVREIAKSAKGFLYLVSSMGVTGVRSEIGTDIASIVREVRAVSDVPVAVGFGVSTPEQAKEIAVHADGVIVGSALVRLAAERGKNAPEAIEAYVRQMKRAV